jgi:hypothetical protein
MQKILTEVYKKPLSELGKELIAFGKSVDAYAQKLSAIDESFFPGCDVETIELFDNKSFNIIKSYNVSKDQWETRFSAYWGNGY